MSNGPIATRFEERVNKLLARLGTDGDVQAFLPQLVRALVDAVSELEATRDIMPTVEAVSETIELIEDIEDNTPGLDYARYVNAQNIPVCWAGGIETTQMILEAIAEEIGAAPGHARLVRITITPTLDILIQGNTIGHIVSKYKSVFRPLTDDGPIATIGELIYAPSKNLWCVKLGDNS